MKMYKLPLDFLESFKPSVYNSLNSEQRKELIDNVSAFICDELSLNTKSFSISNDITSYGSYSHFDLNDPNDILIEISEGLVLSNSDITGYVVLSTIVHEIEHYRQEMQEPQKYLQTLKSPTTGYNIYYLQTSETDAYNFEIQFLKSVRSFYNDPNFDARIKDLEQELSDGFVDEKNILTRTQFLNDTYKDTINEIVNTYSHYAESRNTILKCTSGRLDFKKYECETKDFRAVVCEIDGAWNCKIVSKGKNINVAEFKLNKDTCEIARLYESFVSYGVSCSKSLYDVDKHKLISFISLIVPNYERITGNKISFLNFCPYSVDDFKPNYILFLNSLQKKSVLGRIFKNKKVSENYTFSYNLKPDKKQLKEIEHFFVDDKIVNFKKQKNIISNIFNKETLDNLILNGSAKVAENNLKDKETQNETIPFDDNR